ncbi:hypothetical protein EVAR_93112_1 [Eumeta japonica]|uniref:Uncharacterized protein n=1 Tax=Eumeta variegata TaxID=151549 RepID=A0A4C1TF49_EUMVA|nr:hypothetical protein EVAR_93112_1 [Eumeta japonica]
MPIEDVTAVVKTVASSHPHNTRPTSSQRADPGFRPLVWNNGIMEAYGSNCYKPHHDAINTKHGPPWAALVKSFRHSNNNPPYGPRPRLRLLPRLYPCRVPRTCGCYFRAIRFRADGHLSSDYVSSRRGAKRMQIVCNVWSAAVDPPSAGRGSGGN